MAIVSGHGGIDAGVSFELENVLIEISESKRTKREVEQSQQRSLHLLTYFFPFIVTMNENKHWISRAFERHSLKRWHTAT